MRHRGFTLIEVLVALMIFGLIATAASRVGSQYIGSFERVRDLTLASWIAGNRMNEVRLLEDFPAVAENREELEYAGRRWRVVTVVSDTDEPSMRRVEVRVEAYRGDSGEPARLQSLSGFIRNAEPG
ncbi:general secretion pathway protein I [Marinobacter daqiaonensis]|uniref:Type II secretion system protein I n=1 Tax=Marinobacter daqiaonensis TaxID=650891 RepID=A0A1I6GPA7_9GAMM|nr:type II secretion system minor pseudopilin GspI [Marinobacter daqiaonensis]SFR44024.1 general secretion pathway protein I [Marinobacter daqiaonensis]